MKKIVSCIAIAALASTIVLFSGCNEKSTEKTKSLDTSSKAATASTTTAAATTAITTTTAAPTSAATEKPSAVRKLTVGKSAEYYGYNITFDSFKFVDSVSSNNPKSGYKFLAVFITVNNKVNATGSVNFAAFDLLDGTAKYSNKSTISAIEGIFDVFSASAVNKGETKKMYCLFEVPESWNNTGYMDFYDANGDAFAQTKSINDKLQFLFK